MPKRQKMRTWNQKAKREEEKGGGGAGGGPQTWDECNPGIRQVEYQVDLSIYPNGN